MSDLDNRGIVTHMQGQIKIQDNQLDDVIKVVKQTKYVAQDSKVELNAQHKQLDLMGTSLSRVDANMISVNNKMKELLKSSNHVWLWVVLNIELVVMIQPRPRSRAARRRPA